MRVGMNQPAAPLPLDAEGRSTLEMWARSAAAPHRVVSQAKASLMAGDGVANSRIATALGISRPTVLDWRARFRAEGLHSVGAVRHGRGREPEITAEPSLIRSRACWPQLLPRQAGPGPRTVSKDLWARSLLSRVRRLRQASLQRA